MKLFLFPHQDDELFIAPLIEGAPESSLCCFLTKGDFYGSSSKVRNAESHLVLSKLGVPSSNIFFFSELHPVSDTFLAENLEQVFEFILKLISKFDITEIYTTAYEGGHPDHDASAFLGAAIGKRINAKVWQYFLYNSFQRKKPFFNVMCPLDETGLIRKKISSKFVRKNSFLFFYYKSQIKTWLALGPFLLYFFLIRRIFYIQEFRRATCRERPHEGILYYESRGWKKFEQFQMLISPFAEKNIEGTK